MSVHKNGIPRTLDVTINNHRTDGAYALIITGYGQYLPQNFQKRDNHIRQYAERHHLSPVQIRYDPQTDTLSIDGIAGGAALELCEEQPKRIREFDFRPLRDSHLRHKAWQFSESPAMKGATVYGER